MLNLSDPIIATHPDEMRGFYTDASMVTIYYRMLPNNNPECKGVAPLVWEDASGCHERNTVCKSTWGRYDDSTDSAREIAVEIARQYASHYIGTWTIRIVEWEDRASWGIEP